MSYSFLDTPIEYLKGVGPKRAQTLNQELSIHTFNDLINYFPFRYIDKSRFYKINEISNTSTYIQLKGKISNIKQIGENRGRRLTAILSDETGTIELIWFRGIKWIKESVTENHEYVVFGKPALFNNKFNIAHPEIEPADKEAESLGESLQPFYNSTEKLKAKGLGNKAIGKLTKKFVTSSRRRVERNFIS